MIQWDSEMAGHRVDDECHRELRRSGTRLRPIAFRVRFALAKRSSGDTCWSADSLLEAPLDEWQLGSRDWIGKHLVRFSHILLAYQNEFCGTDNSGYFMRVRRQLQASHACRVENIAHVPGNSYLFASGANHLGERGDRHS